MEQLAGRVALVPGGASGIGAAVAKALAREGAAVVVTDVDGDGAATLAGSLAAEGRQAFGLAQDVTDEERWREVMQAAEARFGRLDVTVANAGICVMGAVSDMSLADWRRQFAINVDGVFLTAKFTLPLMRRTGGGSMIIMSSAGGLRGSAGFSGYCASKAAVRVFAKSVALECAGLGDGIRVNSLHPGVIATPLWDTIPLGGREGAPARRIDPQRMAESDAPMGRAGTAEEVAASVVFLASEASSYMTGAELVLDGGLTAGAMPRRRRPD